MSLLAFVGTLEVEIVVVVRFPGPLHQSRADHLPKEVLVPENDTFDQVGGEGG
jgi:hypothetical protein